MIKDVLEAMLESQRMLQKEIGHDFEVMTPAGRMEYLRTMTLACTDELHEALNETGWKPWATSNHINAEEWRGEMADAWLFFMNLMLVGGMTADDLVTHTARKQDNQYKRLREKYDGVSGKCPRCKRAYDNKGVKCTPAHAGPDGAKAARCGYEKDLGIAVVSNEVDTSTCCGFCNMEYGEFKCHPATTGGFGWCGLNHRSFVLDGVKAGA